MKSTNMYVLFKPQAGQSKEVTHHCQLIWRTNICDWPPLHASPKHIKNVTKNLHRDRQAWQSLWRYRHIWFPHHGSAPGSETHQQQAALLSDNSKLTTHHLTAAFLCLKGVPYTHRWYSETANVSLNQLWFLWLLIHYSDNCSNSRAIRANKRWLSKEYLKVVGSLTAPVCMPWYTWSETQDSFIIVNARQKVLLSYFKLKKLQEEIEVTYKDEFIDLLKRTSYLKLCFRQWFNWHVVKKTD